MFFGLQYYLIRYLSEPITASEIFAARDLYHRHFGQDLFNTSGWGHILSRHHGRLPLKIDAVPEGTMVPTGNVLMTVENTDPAVPWLTNYVESLLVQTWYPSTVGTQSREIKGVILDYLERTGDPSLIDFKLHDFGFRGSTSPESAAIGGCAHLVNFKGTDTIPALILARDYYYEPMAGFSVPAAEHSTITAWGRERELDAYRNMLDQYPTGIVAVVSDSYDVFNACKNFWGGELRDRVVERDGVLVVRPDSGEPVETVLKVLQILGDAFGVEKNDKGFNVLHPKVRVIQGDGIDHAMVDQILSAMERRAISADNITFGSGGALLQKGLDRDTSKYAFKASWIAGVEPDGTPFERNVSKDPVTDHGKRSMAGRLKLVGPDESYGSNLYMTVNESALNKSAMKTVFLNGYSYVGENHEPPQMLAEIRKRAEIVSKVTA